MKRLSFKKLWIGTTFLIFSFEAFAQTSVHRSQDEFKHLYKNDRFEEAIQVLKKMDNKEMPRDQRDYYEGLCLSRLQKYDSAIQSFQMAIKEENQNPELFYEYGQALYANNNLRAARTAFLRSANKNINYVASVYYIAYISELLEDYINAKYNYSRLIKDPRTDKKMLQVSLYQYSRILLLMMRQEEKTLIKLEKNLVDYIPRYVLPLLKRAYEVDKTSKLAGEIQERIRNLQNEFNLDPNVMVSGRRISPHRLFAYLAQRIKYDTNIALTKQESAFFESEGYLKYDFVHRKEMIFSPDVRVVYARYKDQKNPNIYQNDSLTMSGDLRTRFEHKVNDRPASFLIDGEYTTQTKDWRQTHHQNYYYRTYAGAVGEQLSFFDSGETTLKFRRSHYVDVTNTINNNTSSINVEQYTYFKEGQHLLITTFDRSAIDYYENAVLNVNTYLLRLTYYLFEIYPTYTLQLGMAVTATDTLAQRAQRGTELTLNPSIDLSKAITDKLRIGVNYNYIDNSSKLGGYAYHRQIAGAELSYTF